MPYQSPEQIPTQGGLPKAEQYYDQTTPNLKVFATPLSFPVDDSKLSEINFQTSNQVKNWQNFMQSSKVFTELYTRRQAENKRKEEAEGMLLAASGGTLTEDSSKSYMNGYYKYQASMDYSTFSSGVQLFAAENMNQWESQEDAENAINSFTDEFLKERPINDTYLNTLLPSVLDVNSKIIANWTDNKVKQVRTDMVNTTIAGVQKQADDALSIALDEFIGVPNLGVLADDPVIIENGLQNRDVKNFLRNELTKAQQDAQEMGLTRTDASEIYINRLGALAVDYGLPGLLDFTSIPDKTGIALDQTVLSETIEKYRDQASQIRQAKLDTMAELKESQRSATLDNYYKQTYTQISSIESMMEQDPLEARKLALQLREDALNEDSLLWELDQSNFRDVVETLNDIVYNPKEFSQVSDESIVIDFEEQLYKKNLERTDLTKALKNGEINQEDYSRLLKGIREQEQETNNNRKAYFENQLVNNGRLFGISEEEVTSILNDPGVSPSTKDSVVQEYIQQQEEIEQEEEAQEEELQREQEERTEAQIAKTQKNNYMDYLTQLSTGDLMPSEDLIFEIQLEAQSEQITASDAEKLINRVNGLLEEADSRQTSNIYGEYTNKSLEPLANAVIDTYSSSPLMDVINPALQSQLKRYWLNLDQQFRQAYGTNPQDSYRTYKQEVIEPLKEYGQEVFRQNFGENYQPQYISTEIPEAPQMGGIQPQSTLETQQQPPTQETTREEEMTQQPQADPYKPIANSTISQGLTGDSVVSIGTLKDDLITQGASRELATSVVRQSAIDQVKAIVKEQGRDFNTKINIQLKLISMGFSNSEADVIINRVWEGEQ